MLLNKSQAERMAKIRDLMRKVHARYMGRWAELRRRRLELRRKLQGRSDEKRLAEARAALDKMS